MNADPELDAAPVGEIGVASGHAALHLAGAMDGIDDARELDQDAVADILDDAAMVRRDQGIDQLMAEGAKPRDRADFIGGGKAAIARHVGGQNRRELSRIGHRPIPRQRRP